ncbi:MAG: DUF2303 family protein [Victivallales bacterium]
MMEENNLKQCYEWGQRTKDIIPRELEQNNKNGVVGLIPDGMQLIRLDEYLPDRPRRKQIELKLKNVKSFIQYVNEQKSDHTRIFGHLEEPYSFRAVIDYHGTSGLAADWCEHNVTLELSLSEQYRCWKKISGSLFKQEDFVEFLKDNRLDIISPDNGQILQLCMELDAHKDSRCTGKVPTNAGMAFSFVEDVQTSCRGEKVEVPSSIRLRIPIFEGMPPVEIECDFKFRLTQGTMAFGVRMLGVEKMLREALDNARKEINEQTELPVYL